jgi:hypothetical protein
VTVEKRSSVSAAYGAFAAQYKMCSLLVPQIVCRSAGSMFANGRVARESASSEGDPGPRGRSDGACRQNAIR